MDRLVVEIKLYVTLKHVIRIMELKLTVCKWTLKTRGINADCLEMRVKEMLLILALVGLFMPTEPKFCVVSPVLPLLKIYGTEEALTHSERGQTRIWWLAREKLRSWLANLCVLSFSIKCQFHSFENETLFLERNVLKQTLPVSLRWQDLPLRALHTLLWFCAQCGL